MAYNTEPEGEGNKRGVETGEKIQNSRDSGERHRRRDGGEETE